MNDTLSLTVDREIRAPAQDVFDAWWALYGEERPEWIADSRLERRVGGRWTVVFRPPGLPEFTEERVITQLDPPLRIAYETRIDAPGAAAFGASVLLELREGPRGTHVTLSEQGFPDEARRDEFAAAWPDVLATLDRLATARRGV